MINDKHFRGFCVGSFLLLGGAIAYVYHRSANASIASVNGPPGTSSFANIDEVREANNLYPARVVVRTGVWMTPPSVLGTVGSVVANGQAPVKSNASTLWAA
jgi:hypothetical protein